MSGWCGVFPLSTKFIDAKGGWSISPSTGALTVLNFQRNDEGTYKCDFLGTGKYLVELKSACEFAVCCYIMCIIEYTSTVLCYSRIFCEISNVVSGYLMFYNN